MPFVDCRFDFSINRDSKAQAFLFVYRRQFVLNLWMPSTQFATPMLLSSMMKRMHVATSDSNESREIKVMHGLRGRFTEIDNGLHTYSMSEKKRDVATATFRRPFQLHSNISKRTLNVI